MKDLVKEIEEKIKIVSETRKLNEKEVESEKIKIWNASWEEKVKKEKENQFISYMMKSLFSYYLIGQDVSSSLRTLITFDEKILVEESFKEKMYQDIECELDKLILHTKNYEFFLKEGYKLRKMKVRSVVKGEVDHTYITEEEEKEVIGFFTTITKMLVKEHLSLHKENIHIALLPYVLTYFEYPFMKNTDKETCFRYLLFLHKQDFGKENWKKMKPLLKKWYQKNNYTCIEDCYRSLTEIESMRYLLNDEKREKIKKKEERIIRENVENLKIEQNTLGFTFVHSVLMELKEKAEKLSKW